MEGWIMRRSLKNRLVAVGLAGLLAATVAAPPASAADLGMPVKAPPITQAPPPEFEWWPLLLLLAIGIPLGLCIGEVICHEHGPPPPSTSGGNHPNALPVT